MNGVKQGVVLSPILYAVYTDGLIERLQQNEVGCHMGSRFTGVLAYADDITLLSPCKSALSIFISVCELDYAAEYDVIFNGSKSKVLYFKADSQLWCHQRYWLMVKLLLYLIKQCIWDILFVQKIVKTLP